MANKKTVVQMYEELLAIAGLTDEQRAFLAKRIEITKKKNASGKTGELTPKQREKMEQNERYKSAILGVMNPNTAYTPTDLVKLLNLAEIASTQKLSPLLTDMVEHNRLVQTKVKGRSYYSLPVAEVVDTETEE